MTERAVDADDRRARIGVALMFVTNGALLANIVPRYPEIKAGLGLDATTYGLAIAAFPAGAILAGLAAGACIRRFGSARVAVAGSMLTALGLLGAGLAPALWLFAAGMLFAGAADAITDVGQNAHSLRVQRGCRRSIINMFHAIWSVGAVTGGAMAAGAMALDLPVGVHLAVSTVLWSVMSLVAGRLALPGPDTRAADIDAAIGAPGGRNLALSPKTVGMLAALVLIAVGAVIVEDGGMSWATLYLSTSLGAPAALAASGYIALVGAQFVGRMIGDPLVDRFGQRAIAQAGGLLIAAGMGLALAFPSVSGTILGFAVAGFGSATLIPAVLQSADELPGLAHGTGLTIVSWLLRFGLLLAPLVVGMIADHAELRIGLLLVPAAGIAVIAFSFALRGRAVSTTPAGPAERAGEGPAAEAR